MNLGSLFREFNLHKDLFQANLDMNTNLDLFSKKHLENYKNIIPDEKLILEKLHIFLQQQYKKKSVQCVRQEEDEITENDTTAENRKEQHEFIELGNERVLELKGKQRILHFPDFKFIY